MKRKSAFCVAQLWSWAFFLECARVRRASTDPSAVRAASNWNKRSHGAPRQAAAAVVERRFATALLLGVFPTDGDVLQHVFWRAQRHGSPLVDALGLDVQDGLVAGGGHAARLLNDEGHGVALVQQAQL